MLILSAGMSQRNILQKMVKTNPVILCVALYLTSFKVACFHSVIHTQKRLESKQEIESTINKIESNKISTQLVVGQ